MEKQINNKRIYLVGVLLILLGSSVFLYNYVNEKIDIAYEMMNKQLSPDDNHLNDTIVNIENNEKSIIEEKKDDINDSYYIGYLEIPKIGIYRGFVDMNSSANTVKINIQIIKPSNYPNIEKGNFILASHSGNGYNAYFKDLYQLSMGDLAYIYYNNIKYTYQITNIYLQPKIGKISIYRDVNKKTMTLVTCTKDDESTQTVYILYLINEE